MEAGRRAMSFAVPLEKEKVKKSVTNTFSIVRRNVATLIVCRCYFRVARYWYFPSPVEEQQPRGHHDCKEDGDAGDEQPGDEAPPLLRPDPRAQVGRGPHEHDERQQGHPQQPRVP